MNSTEGKQCWGNCPPRGTPVAPGWHVMLLWQGKLSHALQSLVWAHQGNIQAEPGTAGNWNWHGVSSAQQVATRLAGRRVGSVGSEEDWGGGNSLQSSSPAQILFILFHLDPWLVRNNKIRAGTSVKHRAWISASDFSVTRVKRAGNGARPCWRSKYSVPTVTLAVTQAVRERTRNATWREMHSLFCRSW